MTEPAPNVIVALSRVMAELPAIGKEKHPSEDGRGLTYAYRGIEQITSEAQALFAKHGVVFVPRVIWHEVREITVNGKPWTDTSLLVEYDVYGPGGPGGGASYGDKITVGPIFAIGRDNSDKGANKALTQAYKYALLQTLCISDAKDDADGQTHEADGQNGEEEYPYISAPNVAAITEGCRKLKVSVADVVLLATDGATEDPERLPKALIRHARTARDLLAGQDPVTLAELAQLRDGKASAATEGKAPQGASVGTAGSGFDPLADPEPGQP